MNNRGNDTRYEAYKQANKNAGIYINTEKPDPRQDRGIMQGKP